MTRFRHQFGDVLDIEHPAELFEPLEGFSGEHVPSISTIIQRLSLGQYVEEFSEGDYMDDQIFDSEYQDRFDILDKQESLLQSVSSNGATPDDNSNPVAEPGNPNFRHYRLRA